MVFLAANAIYLFAIPLVLMVWRGGRPGRHAVFAGLMALLLGLGIARGISRLAPEARPFAVSQVHQLIAHRADAGMPSSHATSAFALAVPIMLCSRRWGSAALTLAALVAVARVYTGLHWPSQVLAGAVLGSGVALVVWWAARMAGAFGDGETGIRLWLGRLASPR